MKSHSDKTFVGKGTAALENKICQQNILCYERMAVFHQAYFPRPNCLAISSVGVFRSSYVLLQQIWTIDWAVNVS